MCCSDSIYRSMVTIAYTKYFSRGKMMEKDSPDNMHVGLLGSSIQPGISDV